MLVLTFTILPFGVLVLLLADRWRQAAANERHAAWESFFFKKTSATLHGSAPGRPQAPPNVPEAIPAQHGNHFFSKKRTPRCMGALLPLKGAQDHPRQKITFLHQTYLSLLEKCRFGAHRGVLHYVLRRQRAILRKSGNF